MESSGNKIVRLGARGLAQATVLGIVVTFGMLLDSAFQLFVETLNAPSPLIALVLAVFHYVNLTSLIALVAISVLRLAVEIFKGETPPDRSEPATLHEIEDKYGDAINASRESSAAIVAQYNAEATK